MNSNEESSKRRKREFQEDHQQRDRMDNLPREVAFEIFSRLPITSLIQSRFVCKSWRKLLNDPELVDLQISRTAQNNPYLIFHTDYPIRNQLCFVEIRNYTKEKAKARKIQTPFCVSMSEFNVIGSCNGLLCLSDSLFDDALYIYNPFTGNYREIPKSNKFLQQLVVYGFGFHPITSQYKIVKIVYYKNSFRRDWQARGLRIRDYTNSEVQVYNLGGTTWKILGKAPYLIEGQSSDTMVNGRVHWASSRARHQGYRGRVIVSFDLADEQFRVVPVTDCVGIRRRSYHLMVLGGCLSAVVYLPYGKLDVWVMKEYSNKDSWVKEYSIGTHYPKLPLNMRNTTEFWMESGNRGRIRMLCLLNNGHILLEYKGESLASYDPVTRKFEDIELQGLPSYFRAIVHVGSLNWIDMKCTNS